MTMWIDADARLLCRSALTAAIAMIVGCGGSPSPVQRAAASSAATAAAAPQGGSLDRCSLLTDAEVRSAIGPHGPGDGGLGNQFGFQGCRWLATAPPTEKAPEGWRDSIEVTVFEKERESWARDQAKGEPITGVVAGARFDSSSGELWFDCGRGRFCNVKARTAASARREQIARELSQLVDKRLREKGI